MSDILAIGSQYVQWVQQQNEYCFLHDYKTSGLQYFFQSTVAI